MKAILISIVIAAVTFIGCAEKKNASKDTITNIDTNQTGNHTESKQVTSASSTEVVEHYLHLKNALTSDDGKEAAEEQEIVSKQRIKPC